MTASVILGACLPQKPPASTAPRHVTDGVDAPPDGIAMCQVGGVVNAKRGRGRP